MGTSSGEVCTDEKALHDKESVMRKQWLGSMFGSASQILTVMASIFVAGAMSMIGPELVKGTAMSQIYTATPVGVYFLAATGIASVLAAGFSMVATRHYSSAGFDQSEANAKHNAKYIVMELKNEATKEQPYYDNQCRNDNRTWVEASCPGRVPPTRIQG